ncbi:YopX family protein [Bacillus pseudomycoides]|uniref:YopX family protein n=1 Tax=Bacillus pseudomycoides TaxID=64104 RepID=UPI000BECAAD4|nr:YopX family protein [Bacillus pseudomycoides]PEE42819.1 hypothetical protein COO02_05730 [Bacillus pseudomycoides]PGA90873.1 hypothetical protein COL91_12225 [Bacillus pseudomycoides]
MREVKAFDKNYKKMCKVLNINFESKIVHLSDEKDGEVYWGRSFDDVQFIQSTGLKDKNGKEIYEGDIVKISGHPFQGSIDIDGNYEVGYNEYMELSCGGWYLFRMRHWAEVIGNKFENPELLKGDGENE